MKKAIFFLVSLLAINTVGMYYNWYLEFQWFDMTLHFLGGLFIAMLMWHYLGNDLPNNGLKRILVVVGCAAFIGVVWEFCEYLANQILSDWIFQKWQFRTYFIGDLDDTLNDLLMDILGALALSFHFFGRSKPGQR